MNSTLKASAILITGMCVATTEAGAAEPAGYSVGDSPASVYVNPGDSLLELAASVRRDSQDLSNVYRPDTFLLVFCYVNEIPLTQDGDCIVTKEIAEARKYQFSIPTAGNREDNFRKPKMLIRNARAALASRTAAKKERMTTAKAQVRVDEGQVRPTLSAIGVEQTVTQPADEVAGPGDKSQPSVGNYELKLAQQRNEVLEDTIAMLIGRLAILENQTLGFDRRFIKMEETNKILTAEREKFAADVSLLSESLEKVRVENLSYKKTSTGMSLIGSVFASTTINGSKEINGGPFIVVTGILLGMVWLGRISAMPRRRRIQELERELKEVMPGLEKIRVRGRFVTVHRVEVHHSVVDGFLRTKEFFKVSSEEGGTRLVERSDLEPYFQALWSAEKSSIPGGHYVGVNSINT
jgi:hypothetical protein